jgi:hypothetical protein
MIAVLWVNVVAPVVTPLVAAPGDVYFGTFDQRTHGLALSPDAAHAELELDGSRSVPFSDSCGPSHSTATRSSSTPSQH